MEVWRKQSALVLFTVAVGALVASGQQRVSLDNKTKTVQVALGSSPVLHCDLGSETFERSRVHWRFNRNGSSLDNSQDISDELIIKSDNSTTLDGKKEEAKFTISNFTYENIGWYFCEVTSEIPRHLTNYSNGTKLVISQSSENTTCPSVLTSNQATPPYHLSIAWWIWIVLGVSAFILIMVLLLTYVLLRRRCIRSRGEDPIYTNMRPVIKKQPSPRPRTQESHLKTNPSSQNLCTPNHGRRYDEGRRKQKL